jgi:hypothetical protein
VAGQVVDPASVHGLKWLDENGDGVRDAGEPGLAGVTIYVDLNDNGVLDEGEPNTVSMPDDLATDLDETGMYWLEDLESGTLTIREVVPDGFVQTFPADPGSHVIDVALSKASISAIKRFCRRRFTA